MSIKFTPGNKANMRLYMQKEYIKQYYRNFSNEQIFQNILNSDDITQGTLCTCLPNQANIKKQGYNDPIQVQNIRVSQILKDNLGGRTTYGNFYKPVPVNYLGGREGQPGGLPKPLRNKY